MTKKYRLGGADFVAVGTASVEHDYWLLGRIRRAGLHEMESRVNETPEEWAKRLLFEVLASGEALAIIGALVMPDGCEAWTPDVAEATARAVGALTDAGEKDAVSMVLMETLITFFETGLCSLTRLETSSPTAAQP